MLRQDTPEEALSLFLGGQLCCERLAEFMQIFGPTRHSFYHNLRYWTNVFG